MTGLVRVVARRGAAGTTVAELRGTVPWRPQPVHGEPDTATVALVQTAACLLAGDDVRIEIEVGEGARLEVRELGATIVHHGRGGPPARLTVDVVLGAGATLAWAAAPLISTAGSAVGRVLRLDAADGAVALLRDTIVLGRADGPGGVLDSRLRAGYGDMPLLDERLTTADPALVRSAVMFGGARVLDSVLLLGRRPADAVQGTMELAGPGAVWRRLGADAAPGMNDGDGIWDRWHDLINQNDQKTTKVS